MGADARKASLAATLAVALHIGAVAYHAAAHEATGEALPTWRTAYVAIAGAGLPFFAILAMWRGRLSGGAVLLALAMLLSLTGDASQHFVGSGSESIAERPGLAQTAAVLMGTASLGLLVAGMMLRRAARQG